jgi:hypothetical protein
VLFALPSGNRKKARHSFWSFRLATCRYWYEQPDSGACLGRKHERDCYCHHKEASAMLHFPPSRCASCKLLHTSRGPPPSTDTSLNIIVDHYFRSCFLFRHNYNSSILAPRARPDLRQIVVTTIVNMRPVLNLTLALLLGGPHQRFEELVAFLAFCYSLERMTIPVLMSFAKTLFSLALLLSGPHQRFEGLVAFLAFCYCLERMTFPVLMSFAKTLFYSECNIRDMVGQSTTSTFLGHRYLPIQIPTFNMCAICQGSFVDPVLTTCFHEFCEYCRRRAFTQDNRCPVCRRRPLSWPDTWPFIRAQLWSYVCSHYAAKQKTLALSISAILLAYLSTDRDLFLNVMVAVVFQVSCNIVVQVAYYCWMGRTILCGGTASQGYRAFTRLHLSVTYFSVSLCY